MNKDIQNIADAVIEAPVEFTIKLDNPSLWDRILIRLKLKKDHITFSIKRPSLRLALKITALKGKLTDLKVPEKDQVDWANEFRRANTLGVAEIVATYIHGNPKEETPKWLIDFVLDNVDDFDLISLSKIVDSQTNILPFISSIASMISLDVVSKSLEASPQDTGEIIAPGES